jgi:hypothetical protein
MNPSDTVSIDAIVKSMYETVSGPAGVARDWERFRGLFVDEARLVIVVSPPAEAPRLRFLSVEDQIKRAEPIFAKEDFFEVEVNRQTEVFGQIAHVLSSYECRRSPDGPPFTSQQKSMQLFNDNSRWWILSAVWHTPRSE